MRTPHLVVLGFLLIGSACAQERSAERTIAAGDVSDVLGDQGEWPQGTVYKHPACGCCSAWVEHMRDAGFKINVVETQDLSQIKQKLGLPEQLSSCHTTVIDGYFVEGHVPARSVIQLLEDRSSARGIAVAGMPLGSPGMEHPSGRVDAYVVELMAEDGSTTPFDSYPATDPRSK